jgi:hypothetical protein
VVVVVEEEEEALSLWHSSGIVVLISVYYQRNIHGCLV